MQTVLAAILTRYLLYVYFFCLEKLGQDQEVTYLDTYGQEVPLCSVQFKKKLDPGYKYLEMVMYMYVHVKKVRHDGYHGLTWIGLDISLIKVI